MTNPMTHDELRRLEKAATAGPWGRDENAVCCESGPLATCEYYADEIDGRANAAFIVAACNFVRQDLPGLLAEREAFEWKPISKAPMDGTYLWLTSASGFPQHIGFWDGERWVDSWRAWAGLVDRRLTFDPAHFIRLPLPQPPEARERDALAARLVECERELAEFLERME